MLVIVLPILLCCFWSGLWYVKKFKGVGTMFGQVKPPLDGEDSSLVVT